MEIILDKEEYLKLCKQVWKRDKYKCRNPLCKKRGNFSPHHIVFRSKIRMDASFNLVTLCQKCHSMAHNHELKIINTHVGDFPEMTDANYPLTFCYKKAGKSVSEK